MSKRNYHVNSRSIEEDQPVRDYTWDNDMDFWEGDGPNNHVWQWFDYQSGYYDD
jgi:hypothetical protein